MHSTRWAITVVAAMTFAACGSQTVPPATEPTAPSALLVHDRWISCEDELGRGASPLGRGEDATSMPRLNATFVPVSVVLCDQQLQGDGGEGLVGTERSSTDVEALVSALLLPDQLSPADICTMQAVLLPWFALRDAAGRWTRVSLPRDVCTQPRVEVLGALGALRLDTVSTWAIREPLQ